jgi:GH24 family phage-related lysozyme (muramidase)
MPVNPSESLFDYIKKEEGFRPEVYEDTTGTRTIGYGTTEDIPEGRITEEQASQIMRKRVLQGATELSNVLTRDDLTQSQQDALIEMQYNVGLPEMVNTGLIKLINERKDNEVRQKLFRYNKARNKNSGQMEILPALQRRANQRAAWWGGQGNINPQPYETGDPLTDALVREIQAEDQAAALGNIPDTEKPLAEGLAQDLGFTSIGEMSRYIDQQDAIGVIEPNSVDFQIRNLNQNQGVYTQQDAQRAELTKRLAKELGENPLVIDAELEVRNENQIRAKYSNANIAKFFPELAQWAGNPENYPVFEENPEQIEGLAGNFKNLGTIERAYEVGVRQYPKSHAMLQLLTGISTPKATQDKVNQIIAEEQELAPRGELAKQLQVVNKKSEQIIKQAEEFAEEFIGEFGVNLLEGENLRRYIAVNLAKLMQDADFQREGEETLDAVYEYLQALYDNPEAAKTIITSAGVSSAGPMAAGALGAVTPVPGGAVAFGWTAGTMLAAGAQLEEDLRADGFVNKETGELDFIGAFADADRAARL